MNISCAEAINLVKKTIRIHNFYSNRTIEEQKNARIDGRLHSFDIFMKNCVIDEIICHLDNFFLLIAL